MAAHDAASSRAARRASCQAVTSRKIIKINALRTDRNDEELRNTKKNPVTWPKKRLEEQAMDSRRQRITSCSGLCSD
jgi:hypothetical protein